VIGKREQLEKAKEFIPDGAKSQAAAGNLPGAPWENKKWQAA
jgi:hypothetical protein